MAKKVAKRGEIWSINDKNTRGHNSLIVKGNKKKNNVSHLPITHAPKTRRLKNIQLNSNPNFSDPSTSYILPKVQISKSKHLGRKNESLKIKDPIDKSIVRNIEKRYKRNKKDKDGR